MKGLVSGIVETRAGACIVHWLLLPDEDTVEGASFSYYRWRGVKDTLFSPAQTVTPTGLSIEHRKMEARQPKETLPSPTLKPMIYLECSTEDTEMNRALKKL